MAKMVYESNLLRKAHAAWNEYRKDKKMRNHLESLSIKERKQEKDISRIK